MQTFREHNQERGVVGLIILGVLVFALIAAALFFVMRAQDNKDDIGTAPTNSSQQNATSGKSKLQINAENTRRKNDVSQFIGSTNEFINNNSGKLPTGFVGGELVGADGTTPIPVQFTHYTTALVTKGEQAPLTADTIRLVAGVSCAEDGSVVAAGSRAIAVQYALQDTSSEFTAACQEG